MPITKKDVEHIAMLARLELTEEEKLLFTEQLGHILEHAGRVSQVDTTSVEPTAHAVKTMNVLRPDVVEPSISTDEALSNSPARENNQFRVPRII